MIKKVCVISWSNYKENYNVKCYIVIYLAFKTLDGLSRDRIKTEVLYKIVYVIEEVNS